jgi:hypothetical protein
MKPLEYITKGMVSGTLLSAPVWDFLDPFVKLIATIAGIILTIFLVRKAWHDTELAKEQRREKRLLNDMKEQELWEKVASNKRKGL